MGFYPEMWGDKTLQAMIRAMRATLRPITTITDYTSRTEGAHASAYNGPIIGSMTAVDLPASSGDVNEPSKSAIQISFDQKKGAPFRVNNIEAAQSNIALLEEFTADAKDAILDAYDLYIVKTMIAGLASANRKVLNDTVNKKLTKADFLVARKTLNAAKAPDKGRYCLVCPEHEADLYEIDDFVSRDKLPNTTAIRDGVIGRLLGFDVMLYNDMPLISSTGLIDATHSYKNVKNVTLFYQSLALGFGRQKSLDSMATNEPLTTSQLVNIWSVFGAKMQKDTYAVSFRDDAAVVTT
jgi:hypothetical protein